MNRKKIFGIAAVIGVLAVIFLFAMRQKDNQYIDFVKQGCPETYPDITFEKAFNNYFGNCKWSYFVSDDEQDVVEFNGKCSYRGQDADIKIQFVLDIEHNYFEIYTASINGIVQSQWELMSIIDLVFGDY